LKALLLLLLLLLAPGLPALGQSNQDGSPALPAIQSDQNKPTPAKKHSDELKQELDVDALALSKIPADPLIQPDPLAPITRPVDRLADKSAQSLRLKFGVTYTFLNQYATITPDSVRHNQFSGRLDFTGAWAAYEHGSTAGSISLLVRSGANIGISQKFNLSDSLGSGLYLNCLQGGGPQGTHHSERPLLAAGLPLQAAFFLCGQDPSQRICNSQHVQ
jgi:porin